MDLRNPLDALGDNAVAPDESDSDSDSQVQCTVHTLQSNGFAVHVLNCARITRETQGAYRVSHDCQNET